jgi:hypothetical protein
MASCWQHDGRTIRIQHGQERANPTRRNLAGDGFRDHLRMVGIELCSSPVSIPARADQQEAKEIIEKLSKNQVRTVWVHKARLKADKWNDP